MAILSLLLRMKKPCEGTAKSREKRPVANASAAADNRCTIHTALFVFVGAPLAVNSDPFLAPKSDEVQYVLPPFSGIGSLSRFPFQVASSSPPPPQTQQPAPAPAPIEGTAGGPSLRGESNSSLTKSSKASMYRVNHYIPKRWSKLVGAQNLQFACRWATWSPASPLAGSRCSASAADGARSSVPWSIARRANQSCHVSSYSRAMFYLRSLGYFGGSFGGGLSKWPTCSVKEGYRGSGRAPHCEQQEYPQNYTSLAMLCVLGLACSVLCGNPLNKIPFLSRLTGSNLRAGDPVP